MTATFTLFLALSLPRPVGSEAAARRAAEAKAAEGARVLQEKEEAVGRVDHLTRQAEAQGDAYDALVSNTARWQPHNSRWNWFWVGAVETVLV